MKSINIFILTIFTLVIAGCNSQNNKITKQDCIDENKKYKIEKQLNYRTGKYEDRVICI